MLFKKHSSHKKSAPFPVVIFRFLLTMVVFVFMLGGLYAAFQGFSGVDPLTINPKVLIGSVFSSKDPKQILSNLANLDVQNMFSSPSPVGFGELDADSIEVPIEESNSNNEILFSLLLVSDSHNDNTYLKRAIEQAKQMEPNLELIIGVGDYTDVGTEDELKQAKLEFDQAGIRYFLIPGDHDLWDARDKKKDPISNYRAIFGSSYQSFVHSGVKFILINNADNYVGISQQQFDWIENELKKARSEDNANLVFVVTHEPLYHPASTHIMGRVTDDLKLQAVQLLDILKKGEVNEIFYGDLHFFSRYQESTSGLKMTTLGAIASTRNTQSPRFAIVRIFTNGTYQVEDVEIR